MSYQHACKLEEQLNKQIAELLLLADSADQIERHVVEQQEYDRKLTERAKTEEEAGKKPRGKELPPPVSGPGHKDQVNLTDPESRIMPKGKNFKQAYNAQANVSTENMLIVGHLTTQHSNDKEELSPMLKHLTTLPAEFGKVTQILCDSRYFSQNNIQACIEVEVEPFAACGREPHNQSALARFTEPAESCPDKETDPVGNMRHRLMTKAGKAIYALRKSTIEPVFGILKTILGLRQFSMRGEIYTISEWGIACTAWNLKRLHCLISREALLK